MKRLDDKSHGVAASTHQIRRAWRQLTELGGNLLARDAGIETSEASDYGFTIELCTPRQPQQKGAVENLVGYVKRAFFRARRFADLTTDLPRQLAEWLVEVNTTRANRATKEIPAVRLAAEQARMKRLAIAPNEYALRFQVMVGPTAMVTHQGIRYAMPAGACGIPATLWLYPDRVKIVTAGSKHEAVHPRFPSHGTVNYLPSQRAAQLAAVAGARKRLYFMRERILSAAPNMGGQPC